MIQIKDSNVTLMVANMDKAITFYEAIGLNLKQRWEDNYAMLNAGSLTIGLHPSHGEATGSGMSSIGLFVDDIAGAKSVLDAANISYKEDIGKSGHYLNFTDLDGNLLYFVKP